MQTVDSNLDGSNVTAWVKSMLVASDCAIYENAICLIIKLWCRIIPPVSCAVYISEQLTRCGEGQKMDAMYTVEFRNPGGFFTRQFACQDQGKFEMSLGGEDGSSSDTPPSRFITMLHLSVDVSV